MDELAKSIEQEFQLGLSTEQSQKIDSIFQAFMREHHFPVTQPVKDSLLRFKYFRSALRVLSPEQLRIYRKKKLDHLAKGKIKEKEKKERQLTVLRQEYKDVELADAQLETILNIKNSFRKQLIDLKDLQIKIINAIDFSLNKFQREEIDKLFSFQLKRYRLRKAESTKQKYEYLNLNDNEAKELSIIEDLESKQRKENGYKGYDPYLIKPEFKEVLTIKQYELYKANKEKQKLNSIQSQIEEDADKSDNYLELKEWIDFQINNILPTKCKIVKQLIKSASQQDLTRIEQLKRKYGEIIEKSITQIKTKHKKIYGSQLPNHLKLRIIKSTLLEINPSAALLSELDLTQNELPSINLTEAQRTALKGLSLQQRGYDIKKVEKKLKGSYASLTSIRTNKEIPEYLDLYSLLMLDSEPQKNIDRMKMRQIAIDDDGIDPLS